MEVSKIEVEPGGQELIETVVTLTGLPESWVRTELDQILEQSGQSSNDVTLGQLREALVAYLEAMQADLLNESTTVLE
jgi:hypothetical protein